MSALYLLDKIPAWCKSDYDKIGKRSKYIVTDMSLAANSLGWDEEEVLFDESINGKLAESWACHEISAQADLAGDYEIFHYRDSDKREIDFILEHVGKETIGIEVKCGSAVGIGDFKNMKCFKSKYVRARCAEGGYVSPDSQ